VKTARHLALLLGLLLLAACTTKPGAAEAQIRERILSIRDAIRTKQPEGIIRWGTPDWTFTGPDGKDFDRAAYLDRARGLFGRIVTLDSLDTTIDRVEVKGNIAEVEITQLMERHERDPATGRVAHLRLRYREQHDWVKADDGWRVRRVRFLGAPERTELP
jgi:ketosteroid isomerase-like protein